MIEERIKESNRFEKIFFEILQWFKNHQEEILKRLSENPYYKKDHMYAAVLSLLCIMVKTDNINMLHESLIFRYFPELDHDLLTSYKTYVKKAPPYYVCKNNIFILF